MADIQTQLPVKLTNNTNTAGITTANALQVDISQTATNATPIVVAGAGTAGTPGTAVLTVQGVAGGTAQAISGTVTANAGTGNFNVVGTLTTNNAAPGANNLGVLPAVASTAAPTYTAGDQVLLSTDLSGNLRVNGTFTPSGTTNVNLTQVAGTAIALGQTTMSASLPVVIASNQSNLVVVGTLTHNNAAPTTTNIGALVAVASTAAPTYTAGDQVLLSTDLSGSLRVNVTTTVTQSTNLTQVGGSAIALGQTTMANSLPVTIASNQSNVNTAVIAQQSAATSGTITTSTSTVSVATAGYNACTVSINGTYAGINFTFEASDDGGTTYYNVAAARSDNSATQTSTGVITANSSIMWDVYLGAVTNFRVRATAYTSGTGNIHLTPTVIGADPAVIATISSPTTNITQIAGNAVQTAASGIMKVGITDSAGSSITLGQQTMANSVPVAIASNQSTLTVAGGLTHNNAAPAANNVGALVAVASTAAPTYTTGDQVLLSTDLAGNLRVSVTSTGGTSTVVGTLTNNNAAPAATNIGVLPAMYSSSAPTYTAGDQVLLQTDVGGNLKVVGTGTAGTAATGVVTVQGIASGVNLPISGTVTANAGTGTFTVAGGLTHNNAAPAANNVGVLPAVASTAAPTYTTGDQVLLSTDLAGNLRVSVTSTGGTSTVVGNLTNNNATPGATNLGVLPAVANSTAPTYTAGDQVLLQTDLQGNLKVTQNIGTGIITSYTDTSAVASGSTGTATYTVTVGKTLFLKQIIASSSGGPCRVQVDYGAGPTIIFVGFYATSSPFLTVTFAQPISIAASTAVNVKIQNNAGAAQDVYATIIGNEQ